MNAFQELLGVDDHALLLGRQEPSHVAFGSGQGDRRVAVTHLGQVLEVGHFQVLHEGQLVDGFHSVLLVAGLGHLQEAPGQRVFDSFPPFDGGIREDVHKVLVHVLTLLQLLLGLAVDGVVDVNVVWTFLAVKDSCVD